MRKLAMLITVACAGAVVPRATQAQGIGITPQVGVYVPGNNFEALRRGADSLFVKKEGAFAMGLAANLGFLRGSITYASSATLQRTRVSGEVGDAKVLAVAGDVVLRPLPRVIIQPYLLLGGGLRREDYSYNDDGISNAFPKADTDFALHGGVGADLSLGPVGISAEITDFLSKNESGDWSRHDGFGFVGLKFKL